MIHICTHTCSHPFCIPWAKRIYRCGTPMVSGSEHLCWLTGGYYQQSQSWCYDIPLIRMPTMISSECLPWYPKTIIIIIIITKYIHRCMHTYVRTYVRTETTHQLTHLQIWFRSDPSDTTLEVRSDLERNVADTEARLKNDIRQKQQEVQWLGGSGRLGERTYVNGLCE